MLENQRDRVVLKFFVAIDGVYDARMVCHFQFRHLASLSLRPNPLEQTPDLCLRIIDIDVANHHNALVSRVIPLLIIVSQFLMFKMIHHFHQTYR